MARIAGFRILLLAALLAIGTGSAPAQDPDAGFGGADPAAAAFRTAIGRLTSPEFEQRKARRLELQRRGYVSILHRALVRDAWGAVLALLKMQAQLDFHLPTNTLVVNVRTAALPARRDATGAYVPPYERYDQYPLHEDRRFPKDPWRK